MWCHVYIPVLPRPLCQVLQAPMPFIVGVSLDTYVLATFSSCAARPAPQLLTPHPHTHTHRFKSVEIPPEIVSVNLDENTVSTSVPVEPIPPRQRQKLLKALRMCANAYGRRSWDWKMHELPSKDSAFKNAARPSDIPRSKGGITIDWDETRALFFKVFTHSLLHYAQCLIFPSKDKPCVCAVVMCGVLVLMCFWFWSWSWLWLCLCLCLCYCLWC